MSDADGNTQKYYSYFRISNELSFCCYHPPQHSPEKGKANRVMVVKLMSFQDTYMRQLRI